MDFSKLNTSAACQSARTIVVEINGEPTDVEIDIIGADAPQAKRAMAALRARMPALETRRAQLQDRVKNLAEGSEEYGKVIDALSKIDGDVTALWCRYMAECTVAWRNIEEDGTSVPFSVEKAEEFYTQSQCLQASVLPSVMDRVGFLGNVHPGSPSLSKTRHD